MPNAELKRKVFGVDLSKVNSAKESDGSVLVKGYFTSDNRDEVGDIITRAATEKAIGSYRRWGNIRYMHQPRPVGKIARIGAEDGLEWNEVEIKVIDPQAVFEVEQGLLAALSVGIICNMEDVQMMADGGWVINSYQLAEISLVDHPANYDAFLKDISQTDELRQLARESGVVAVARALDMTTKKDLTMAKKKEKELVETVETEVTPVAEDATKDLHLEVPAVEETPAEEPIETPAEEVVEEVPAETEAVAEEVVETPAEEEETEEVATEEPEKATTPDFVKEFKDILDEIRSDLKELKAKSIVESEESSETPEIEQAAEAVVEESSEIKSLKETVEKQAERIASLEALTKELPAERKGLVESTNVDELTEEEDKAVQPANLKSALSAHFNVSTK